MGQAFNSPPSECRGKTLKGADRIPPPVSALKDLKDTRMPHPNPPPGEAFSVSQG